MAPGTQPIHYSAVFLRVITEERANPGSGEIEFSTFEDFWRFRNVTQNFLHHFVTIIYYYTRVNRKKEIEVETFPIDEKGRNKFNLFDIVIIGGGIISPGFSTYKTEILSPRRDYSAIRGMRIRAKTTTPFSDTGCPCVSSYARHAG